jgi:hypothetical protein
MAEGIRLKVWLVGLAPIVVIVGAVVALVATSGEKASAPSKTLSAIEQPSTVRPATGDRTPEPTVPSVLASASAAPPPVGPALTSYAPPAASDLLRGPPPEPIPELDELTPPKGSPDASTEDKLAYRQKVFADLDAKERSLEREVAAARRSGDAAMFKQKSDTLAYLRARRQQVEEMFRIRRQEARQDAGGS